MTKPYTILVTGSRHWSNWDAVYNAIKNLKPPKDAILVHGGATGADRIAYACAGQLGIKSIAVRADWSKYGKAAGPIRNQEMIDTYRPDVCLAFPWEDSRGTWDCVQRAKKAGIKVIVIRDE